MRDLKKFRPHIRIQTFIDYFKNNKGKKVSEAIVKKKKAVVRDWFKLVLWYVRLRKVALSSFMGVKNISSLEGQEDVGIPSALLRVE